MNKFIVLALLACSSMMIVSAMSINEFDNEEPSSALNPSNDEEIAQLDDKTKPFSDFCIQMRDFVVGDVRSRTNGLAAFMFNTLFTSAENIGANAVEVSRDATNKLSAQIRDPSAKIAEAHNEVEQIIAEAQKSIQEDQSQPKSMVTGFMGVLLATKNAVTGSVMDKMNSIKSKMGLSGLTDALRGACERVDAYERDIRANFDNAKQEVVAADPSLASIDLGDVACVTTRRIIRLDGICKFAMAAKNPLIKAITYRPNA